MNGLTVRFWGTRGSIPTPGRRTEKYGGNTTCLELRHQDTILIFDAGSGIRQLSAAWNEEATGDPVQARLLFTHLHWDHIQGFPFFSPGYRKGNVFTIHGEDRPSGSIRDLLSGQMQGAYFPVPLAAMQAELRFEKTTPEFTVGAIRIRTMPLPHPGGCLGYRLEVEDSVFVLATDSELDQAALNKDEIRDSHSASRRYAPELLDFFRGANTIVIDSQYTDADYQLRRGWGHNSIATVVDLCAQVCPDMVVLFHHDPESHDEKVSEMVHETATRLEPTPARETLVLGARERMTLQVCKPIKPLALPMQR